MKNESLHHATKKKKSEYGKLRNLSDETVNKSNKYLSQDELSLKSIHSFRTSTSESNFLDHFHLSSSSHLQTPFSESIVSDTVLYSNSYAPPSYEDAIQDKYTSVDPLKLKPNTKLTTTYDSTSASSFYTYNSSSVSTLQSCTSDTKRPAIATLLGSDESLRYWVTSLKQQIFDYADDSRQFDFDAIKSIPPKSINQCERSNVVKRNVLPNMTAMQSNENEQTNLRCRVDAFKTNLLRQQMHSRRNAIYIDDSTSTCGVPFESVTSNENETTAQAHDVEIVETLQVVPAADISHELAYEATSQYLQMLKAFYMTQIALSSSLNRITLVCGDRRCHFVVKLLVNQPQRELHRENQIVRPTEAISFDRIFEVIEIMSIRKQLVKSDKYKRRRERQTHRAQTGACKLNSVEDFVQQSTNPTMFEMPARYSIDDFTKSDHPSWPECNDAKTFDEFHRPVAKITNSSCNKTISDFAKRNSNYSSPSPQAARSHDETNETMGQSRCEENIYQPIWMFKTIGAATETSYDVDSLNNFNNGPSECDDVKAHDGSEWEVAEGEFLFSQNRISSSDFLNSSCEAISHNLDVDNKAKQTERQSNEYETVCILYNTNDSNLNKIIYDYNANIFDTYKHDTTSSNRSNKTIASNYSDECVNRIEANKCKTGEVIAFNGGQVLNPIDQHRVIEIKFDSVNAWKGLLRTIDYIEDEEDVILTETLLPRLKTAELSKQRNQSMSSLDSLSDIGSDSTVENSNQNKTTPIPSSSPTSSVASTVSSVSSNGSRTDIKIKKKESRLLNRLHNRRLVIPKMTSKANEARPSSTPSSKHDHRKWERARLFEPKKPTRTIAKTNVVFGSTIKDVEKDELREFVPKFVTECVRIIEEEENLRTSGIYRASGRKDCIDEVRRLMNSTKKPKPSKYKTLVDNDIHTITGALKQFFRELKTELIPDSAVKHLQDYDLDTKEEVSQIKIIIEQLEPEVYGTLKYLFKHLAKVDEYREFNLMNATNLSIVWGVSLFALNVSLVDAFETSDLNRKNYLVKILIEKYKDIFVVNEQLI